MSFLFALFTWATLMVPIAPEAASVALDCPKSMAHDEVCVFTDATNVVAINPTSQSVKVVVQIQRVENVELIYRYPFVEELPPRSSRILIKYRIVKTERPFALDYDWGWKAL